MKSDSASKYYCKQCGNKKFVPMDPESKARIIRTGCEVCETITTHKAVGVK